MKPRPHRLHLLGASGSGTTTLGRRLAEKLGLPQLDADDVFWEKTEPPYQTKRPLPERRRLLEEFAAENAEWVISGSLTGWGDGLRSRFSHVLFLTLPPSVRLERLRAREHGRYGRRILPGGDMHSMHEEFLAWAALYDAGGMDVRSRAVHEHWLRSLPCPVLRFDGTETTERQAERVIEELARDFGQVEVSLHAGLDAAPVVEPFYAGLGRGSTLARPGDVFFVARAQGKILGAVRYCVEEGTALLRGMLIAEEARRQGVGQKLLAAFDHYLREQKISLVFCVPYGHLAGFYAGIGFRACADRECPAFLVERREQYRREGLPDPIVMRRG